MNGSTPRHRNRGRTEVHRLRQRLNAAFERIKEIDPNPELQSDFACYLCVLVSGFVEKAITALLVDHAHKNGSPTLHRFVARSLDRQFTNPNCDRILDLLGRFDQSWRKEMEGFLVEERKEAINSIVSLRNKIAHGEDSPGVTLHNMRGYYRQTQRVVERIADICSPAQAGA